MNPYFLTNILLSCLIAFKVLISAFNRTEITPTDFVVLLIAVGVFYMGMITIAEYLTGQKTFTMWGHYDELKVKARRDDPCAVIYMLTFSLFAACVGAAMILTVGL